ncbi:MAG: ABC transporter permease [Austwickia sp.]|jgi:cell division transport system permease protein|nr:ABC transporter permease [Austwickia sp.]MBK9101528.1 ABC transporter permease [Austwickia sp.]
MRPRFLLGEVWTGLRRSASMAVSIILVSAVSLFFLGVGLLAQRQVEAAKGYWYDKVEVSVFLCTARSSEPDCKGGAVTPTQRLTVETLLQSMKPVVKEFYFEDQQTAYQRFREQFRNNPVFADTPADAIPAAFRVRLSDPKDYQQISTAFSGMPGVGAVKDIRQVLEPLFKVLDFLRYAAWGLAALMLLCTVLLTSTTIRQVAFSRRRETAIKRVVGASKAAIQLPFMAETLIAALFGAGLAIASLWASVAYGVRSLSERFRDFAWITVADVWAVSPVIVGVAVLVALLVSWLTLIRYVRL